ncbi:glutamine cyclotransferase [Stylonychia lemnae]|uniref:Glutamine cyclotransferase n=1 Tax=Stylonychia lemnae TaxID=5949 RepID=A0A078AYT3_STYLE|nr:glutamine cyclotransferase [Stylonychia lemnae]|eukprot:CDW87324.1 glutamine cyclotransferase [Stylonychia lemnae]
MSRSDISFTYLLLLFISAAVLVTTFYYKEESLGLQLNTNINKTKAKNNIGHGPKVIDRIIANPEEQDQSLTASSTSYKLVNNIRMEQRIFTQGLEFINNTHLIISGGLYQKSFIGILGIDYTNEIKIGQGNEFGAVLVSRKNIDNQYFGEGATIFKGLVYQLTWKQRKVLVFGLQDLILKTEYSMPADIKEGWGITHDNDYLYISEGSNKIFAVQIVNGQLKVMKTIIVTQQIGQNLDINELELVGNYIYANNYQTNNILKIDKNSGSLMKTFDMSQLYEINRQSVISKGDSFAYSWINNVLNGIAYNKNTGRFFITGKQWDFIFDVELIDQ